MLDKIITLAWEDWPYTIMCASRPKSVTIFRTFVECILSIILKPPQYFMSGPICFDSWYLQRSDQAIICCGGILIWPRAGRQPSSGSVSRDPWRQETLLCDDDPSWLLSSSSAGLAWAALQAYVCSWHQSFLFVCPVSKTFLLSNSGPGTCSGHSVAAEHASWFCFVSIDCQHFQKSVLIQHS